MAGVLSRLLPRVAVPAAVSVLIGAAAPGGAQAPAPGQRVGVELRRSPAVADSEQALGEARGAQRRFELLRRTLLTREPGAVASRCQERIGRFCYWDDEVDTTDVTTTTVPPEPERVTAARGELLARIEDARARIPGDQWVLGQHVRYLLEAERIDDAVSATRSCEPRSWWCDALGGLALHAARDFAAADSAFGAAMASMPEAERCEWNDIATLLDVDSRERYRRLSCAERVAENERLWWLADPLHSRPGNDRRTEHFSRLTLNRLQERASSGYGIGWGVDLAEILVRYGWPSHWTQDWPRLYSDARPPITAHHWMPSYHFLPRAAALDLRTAGEDAWSLRGPQPRERYAPRYGSFAWLEHQLAAFPRGDSLIVVAAYDATADTIMADTLVDAALVLTNGPRPSDSAAVLVPGAPRSGRLVVRVADAPLLASVEVIGERRIHWARSAVATALSRGRRILLSDLAFFTPGDSLPTTFDEFLIVMRPRTTARNDERLGLYWELSGAIDERTPLSARIDVVRAGRSWLRRTGERIGVVQPQRGVRLGWGEVASAREGALPRAVSLDLSTLEPGSYRIEVTIQAEGEQPMVASRKLTIVR